MSVVYKHIRLDNNKPFYIGIGGNKKRATIKQHKSDLWNIIANKSGYRIEYVYDDISNEDAKQVEWYLIKYYGKIIDNIGGTLANITDGGESCLGLKRGNMSDEHKRKVSMGRTKYTYNMYSKELVLIKSFNSMQEAEKYAIKSCIVRVCNKERKTAGGYVWDRVLKEQHT